MSWEKPLFELGQYTAGANYSSGTSQFTIVYTTGGTSFKKQTSNGGPALGVLQDTPSSGRTGHVAVFGITKVRVNNATHTAIVSGDKLCASTSAGAIISTGVAKYVLGRALENIGTNTTGIIAMLITHQGSGSSGAAATA